jgi:hypothetical protein
MSRLDQDISLISSLFLAGTLLVAAMMIVVSLVLK